MCILLTTVYGKCCSNNCKKQTANRCTAESLKSTNMLWKVNSHKGRKSRVMKAQLPPCRGSEECGGLRCLSSKLTNNIKPTENFHTPFFYSVLTEANKNCHLFTYLKVQVRKGVKLSAYQTVVLNIAWIKISACTHHSEEKKKIFLPLMENSPSLSNNHSMHFWLLGEFCSHQKGLSSSLAPWLVQFLAFLHFTTILYMETTW